ncbi:hypothetical protein FZEAL_8072, partial [Fusarium zealandicum]
MARPRLMWLVNSVENMHGLAEMNKNEPWDRWSNKVTRCLSAFRLEQIQTVEDSGVKGLCRCIQQDGPRNFGDSLVVTDPTTNPPLTGLSMGERTGSRVFRW